MVILMTISNNDNLQATFMHNLEGSDPTKIPMTHS